MVRSSIGEEREGDEDDEEEDEEEEKDWELVKDKGNNDKEGACLICLGFFGAAREESFEVDRSLSEGSWTLNSTAVWETMAS